MLFLRAAAGDDPRTGLWVLDLPDGEERVVVEPTSDEDLPAAERMRRERVREGASGVVSYTADDAGRVAAFALGGRLHVVEVDSAEVRALGDAPACFDPRPDPTGRQVAYVDGANLRVVGVDGRGDRVLAGEAAEAGVVGPGRVRGGRGDGAAPRLLVGARRQRPTGGAGRRVSGDQWWIADPAHPDRQPAEVRYPAAGTANADVSLWLVGLDGDAPRGSLGP